MKLTTFLEARTRADNGGARALGVRGERAVLRERPAILEDDLEKVNVDIAWELEPSMGAGVVVRAQAAADEGEASTTLRQVLVRLEDGYAGAERALRCTMAAGMARDKHVETLWA